MKKSDLLLSMTFLILMNSQLFAAVKVVECEDENGNRSYQSTCPPGFTIVGEKNLNIGKANNSEKKSSEDSEGSNLKAIMYMIPDCEACDSVREFLQSRKIPLTEKDVSDNIDVQKELTDKTGNLQVPTTFLADDILVGFSRTKFLDVIKQSKKEEISE